MSTREDCCQAVIYHGPGRQSRTRCRLSGPHDIHEAYYGNYSLLARWRGDKVFTGYFDEPPDDPDEHPPTESPDA